MSNWGSIEEDHASWRISVRQHLREARKAASKIRKQAQGARAASIELRLLSQELRARVKREASASRVRLNCAVSCSENLGGKYINTE